MTQQSVFQILNQHLGQQSVEVIDEQVGIYRCHKDFQNKPYQIIYIDCSNTWITEDFDAKKLEIYQEKILLKDYYKNSGSLQWSFYYAFIAEETNIQDYADKKKAIESDELYARKLVISESELSQWLSKIEDLSKPSDTIVEQDLSAIWINRLKEIQLDAVFLAETYVSGVDNYLENTPTLAQEEDEEEGIENKEERQSISFIKSLEFIQYRKQAAKTYNFGKVNLIKGINGAGKTSLLEAIELVLCGKTNRNQDSNTTNIRLRLTLGDDTALEHTPKNIALFKDRDSFWYNNAGQHSNRLHISFNKYNFYNTDAAYLLSTDSNKTNVKKAFEDIALGEEVNYIENRLKGFYERFYTAFTQYNKLTNEFSIELEAENKLVKELKELDQNPEKFLKELLEEAGRIKWKMKNEKTDKFISSFERDLTSVKFYLQSVQNVIDWENSISYNWIVNTTQELSNLHKDILNINVQINDQENELELITKKLNEFKIIDNIFEKLSLYYNDSRFEELFGLLGKIKNIETEITQIKNVNEILDEITTEDLSYFTSDKYLNQITLDLDKEIEFKTLALKTDKDKKKKLEEGFNQLEAVISEIKTQGKHYLTIETQATKCPLCHAEYTHELLTARIQNSWDNIRSTSVLEDLHRQVSEGEKTLKQLKEKREIATKLIQIASFLELNNNEIVASRLLQNINDVSKELFAKEINLKGLANSKEYFDRKELTEFIYNELIAELSELGIEVKDGASFDKEMSNVKAGGSHLTKNTLDFNISIKALTEKRNDLLKSVRIEAVDLLQSRLNRLRDAKDSFDEILKIIDANKLNQISVIEKSVDKFQKLFEQYKSIKRQKDEYDTRIISSKEKTERLQTQIQINKSYRDKAETAYKAIEEIQQTNSKASFLNRFIEKNKEEIAEIFKMIHSPKEFDSLNFEDGGQISLTRIQDDELAKLSEISTGQRSALALSVFSALNRKLKNGPNILMFDDPVSNIDDLNILSYFDYLREVAINGNRQIFFSTANENAAFLFKQKFDFLGKENFKIIELNREID